MNIGRPPYPVCPECGQQHPPELPHKAHSIDYQLRFYARHGRAPTWEDSMAHCSEEIKEAYRHLLVRGWKQDPGSEPRMSR
jgi:hypothetical protein